VSAQITDRVLTCFRIGDPDGAHPIYDSEGARLYPGRWNTAASPIIYTSEHYSTAMLEKLVHANTVMPPNQHYIRITIPNGVSYEIFPTAKFPGWDGKRSALLLVPSIPARVDRNILINSEHPDAKAVGFDLPEPIWWDDRLYS